MTGETTVIPTGDIAMQQVEAAMQQTESKQELELQATKSSNESPEIKIDQEFANLIPPLSEGEKAALKEDIAVHGCRDSLVVLKGEGIILDGHHRYRICQELGIPYQVVELEFPSHTEAKIWMIKNQRGRRNLNESQRAMLAVTLEALYSEQAKERMGTRTDLGQNLDPSEAGRSAEKAAKDMGVSHQTVSYAKKVATSGIPELVRMVEAKELAVSTASLVAELTPEQQKEVQGKIAAKAARKVKDNKISSRVILSEVEEIIRNFKSPKNIEKTPEENLVKVEQRLNSIKKILEGVETTTQREKLDILLELGEQIILKVKAIGLRSPIIEHEVETVPSDYQLELNAHVLKTFLSSVVPSTKGVRLKFEAEGLRIDGYNEACSFVSSSILPRGYFSKYELEPCELCLRDIDELSRHLWKGKVQIFIEPETTYHHDRVMKLFSGYDEGGVTREDQIHLTQSEWVLEDRRFPQLDPTCCAVISISSKDFVNSLRDVKRTKVPRENPRDKKTRFASYAKISIEESMLRIDSRSDRSIQKIPCNVLTQGESESEFDVSKIADGNIGDIVEKASTITLGLGKDYPLIMNLTIGKMEVAYILSQLTKEEPSGEYEIYRGVLLDPDGNPVLDELEDPTTDNQEKSEAETETANTKSAETGEAESDRPSEIQNDECGCCCGDQQTASDETSEEISDESNAGEGE